MIEQILGWIGNICFFYGVYTLAKKNISGFYINSFANLLYTIQSILMQNWALLFCSIGLLTLNIYGIVNWRKK